MKKESGLYKAMVFVLAALLLLTVPEYSAMATGIEETENAPIEIDIPLAGVGAVNAVDDAPLAELVEEPEETAETVERPQSNISEQICFAPGIDFEELGISELTADPSLTAAELRAEKKVVYDMDDATAIRAENIGEIAVVNVSKALNIREDPSADADIIGKLYQNSGVIIGGISGTYGEWAYITSGKVSGWVVSKYLVAGEHGTSLYHAIEPMVATATTNLNVRKETDKEADILAEIKAEASYPVTAIEGDWVKIQISSNDEGYVLAEYVAVTKGLYIATPLIEDDQMQEQVDSLEAARIAAREAAEAAEAKRKAEEEAARKKAQQKKSASGSGSSSSSVSKKKDSNTGSDSKQSTGWTYMGKFRVTFYCVECNTPKNSRRTASGKSAKEWHTCAVKASQIPLGTTVKVDGYGTFVAEDTGVSKNQIDLFVNPSECDGLYYRDVWIKN